MAFWLGIGIYLVMGIAYVIWGHFSTKQKKYRGRIAHVTLPQAIGIYIFVAITWIGAMPYTYLYDRKWERLYTDVMKDFQKKGGKEQ